MKLKESNNLKSLLTTDYIIECLAGSPEFFNSYGEYFDDAGNINYDEVEKDFHDDIEDVIYTFSEYLTSKPIKIYRKLHGLKSEDQVDLRNPGAYWTFDYDTALNWKEEMPSQGPFNPKYDDKEYGKNECILEAEIDPKYVDWEDTIQTYCDFSIGDGNPENEIRVEDVGKIKNIKIIDFYEE
jgi:hypothetical protein